MNTIFYTVEQVAEMVQMTPNYIYGLTRNGMLGHYKIGGAIRITKQQFDDWLASKRVYNKREMKGAASLATVKAV